MTQARLQAAVQAMRVTRLAALSEGHGLAMVRAQDIETVLSAFSASTNLPLSHTEKPSDLKPSEHRTFADRVEELESALAKLEGANEALCAVRSQAVYDQMMADCCAGELHDLDEARREARDVLARQRDEQ